MFQENSNFKFRERSDCALAFRGVKTQGGQAVEVIVEQFLAQYVSTRNIQLCLPVYFQLQGSNTQSYTNITIQIYLHISIQLNFRIQTIKEHNMKLKLLPLFLFLLLTIKINTGTTTANGCTVSNGNISLSNNQTYIPKINLSTKLLECPSSRIDLDYSVTFDVSSCITGGKKNIPCANNSWNFDVTSPCQLTGVDQTKILRIQTFASLNFTSPNHNYSSTCDGNTQSIKIIWGTGTPDPEPNPQPASDSNTPLIIGAIVGGIVIIGVIFFIVRRIKSKKSNHSLLQNSEN